MERSNRLISTPIAGLCATLVLAGCMTVTRIRPEEPAPPIEVRISAPAAEVFRRTLAAFGAEGLTVAQAEESGGVIASAPVLGEGVVVGALDATTMQTYLIYRANIIPAADGTSIVKLSLWIEIHERSSRGVVVHPETPPAANCPTHPVCGQAWSRLERIAERLRTAA